jgi:hypothetical protein
MDEKKVLADGKAYLVGVEAYGPAGRPTPVVTAPGGEKIYIVSAGTGELTDDIVEKCKAAKEPWEGRGVALVDIPTKGKSGVTATIPLAVCKIVEDVLAGLVRSQGTGYPDSLALPENEGAAITVSTGTSPLPPRIIRVAEQDSYNPAPPCRPPAVIEGE